MSDPAAIAIIAGAIAFDIVLASIAWMKGKRWTAIIGLFSGLVAVVGAVRLAKPDSRWAQSYDSDKMRRAQRRFPGLAPDAEWQSPEDLEPAPVNPQDSVPWEDEEDVQLDRISRRARDRG